MAVGARAWCVWAGVRGLAGKSSTVSVLFRPFSSAVAVGVGCRRVGVNDVISCCEDASDSVRRVSDGESAEYAADKARHLYLVPAAGSIEVNGVRVNARDGAAIRDEATLKITALEDAELVLVDAA